jgi:hypothetical protein
MNCVNDVCCDTPCTEPNHICNLAGRAGICLPITAAPAPALSELGKLIGLTVLILIGAAGLYRYRRRA